MPEEKKQTTLDPRDIDEYRVLAGLSYVCVLCFIPLLMGRSSKFAQFHAKQGLVLFIAEIIIMIVAGILMFIPFFGWLVNLVLYLLVIILSIMGILKALAGEKWEMPILGQYAKKIKF